MHYILICYNPNRDVVCKQGALCCSDRAAHLNLTAHFQRRRSARLQAASTETSSKAMQVVYHTLVCRCLTYGQLDRPPSMLSRSFHDNLQLASYRVIRKYQLRLARIEASICACQSDMDEAARNIKAHTAKVEATHALVRKPILFGHSTFAYCVDAIGPARL